MSHELRTPLNAILGFSQLLDMTALDEEQHEEVRHISVAGNHLLDLINEVLEISYVESGHLHLSLEPVAVVDVVNAAFDLVRPLADRRGITLSHDITDASCHVHADRQRLLQILVNLTANAVKYNNDNGSVRIKIEPNTNERCRINIIDTGIGIDQHVQNRLFIPFERLEAANSGIEGTGLGLALAKQLIEAMHGRIGVQSSIGHGSTFWIELEPQRSPETNDQFNQQDSNVLPDPPSEPLSILYIEDNPSNVQLVERVLSHYPTITCLISRTGEAGLRQARDKTPDVILLDITLPDLPGTEVLRRLRDDRITAALPIIVVSADATPTTIRRLLDNGANSYLPKPINVVQLMTTIEAIVQA